MKQLYLVRHARAAQSAGEGDSKRPLLKSGRRDAKTIAKKLKKLAAPPQLILTSSAKRAVQTAEIFAKTLALKSKKIQKRAEIYDAGSDAILTLLRELHADVASVMVVGHVPVLNDLAHLLLKDFKDDIPTSGVVAIDLNIQNWSELGEGVSRLLFSEFPPQNVKEPGAKAIRQKLQAAISTAVAKELNRVDRKAAGKMAAAVEKAGAKISRKFSKLLKKAQNEAAKSEKKKSAKKQAALKSKSTKSTN